MVTLIPKQLISVYCYYGRITSGAESGAPRSESLNQKIRLAVIATNREVLPFWERQGFRCTGEIKPWRQEKIASEAILMEKQVRGI